MFEKGSKYDDKQCRICFEAEETHSRLVSPCKCKGSQKFVHEECLAKWQVRKCVRRIRGCGRLMDVVQRVAMAQHDYRNAYFCPVCNSRYAHPSIPWIMLRQLWYQT